MQLLESSVLGLRSARHVFRLPEGPEVTLFPMVHLADPGFFETVYADAFDHDAALVEGIRSPVVRRLTRQYRWMEGALGGLTVQPPWPKPDACRAEILRADLPPEAFEAHWRETPARTRWLFAATIQVYGLWLRATATRDSLARKLVTDDLPSRTSVLVWSPETAGLYQTLLDRRDAYLIRVLDSVLARDPPPAGISIVYGARHVSAVIRFLDTRGARPVDSRWLTAFAS